MKINVFDNDYIFICVLALMTILLLVNAYNLYTISNKFITKESVIELRPKHPKGVIASLCISKLMRVDSLASLFK